MVLHSFVCLVFSSFHAEELVYIYVCMYRDSVYVYIYV